MEKKVSIVKAFDYGIYLLRDTYWQVVWPILILGFIESLQVVTRNYIFFIPLIINFLRVAVLYSIVKYILYLAERKHCNWYAMILSKEKYLNLFYYSTLVFLMFKLIMFSNDALNIAVIDKALLILIIYLWIRFYFSAFFIVDHGVNLVQGLRLSYEITKGFLFTMAIFFVVFILVNLSGVIIIIIGRWIVTYPLILVVSIYIYQKLIDASNLDKQYKSNKKSIKN
ncbi:hypothetical protein [Halanaerobacter jeridensis]|uniref:Uncharacterized protein n=1 Tax=Halanaerobacter jeridensis TaxID=706427 RepID=A0A939BR05_9FIRM|nr:hypothetical protein [Halanaerobacter jeridensis]MBM7555486.1 hypothetical protein [Halanaerobacter jeridensis]